LYAIALIVVETATDMAAEYRVPVVEVGELPSNV
jgi:hypothetical protein